jgi:hypothetical protein
MMKRALTVLLLGAALGTAHPAFAGDTDATARNTARQVGQEAARLFEASDYAGALEKFNTADSLLPSPTLGLYAARCMVKLGRLVAASERYLEVSRMQLDRAAPKVMRKAQVDAVAEREELLPRIPTLEILLDGARGSGVEVTVDNKPLLAGLLGERRKVDPGRYRIVARRADATVEKEVNVAPGDAARVVLAMPPLPPPPAERMPMLRKVGWGAIGAAGAGVIIGAVSGGVAAAKGHSLLSQCPNHVCPTQADLSLDGSYNAARAASTAGFVIAGIGLAVGVPILVISPKLEPVPRDTAGSARLSTWIGWGAAGARGDF